MVKLNIPMKIHIRTQKRKDGETLYETTLKKAFFDNGQLKGDTDYEIIFVREIPKENKKSDQITDDLNFGDNANVPIQ